MYNSRLNVCSVSPTAISVDHGYEFTRILDDCLGLSHYNLVIRQIRSTNVSTQYEICLIVRLHIIYLSQIKSLRYAKDNIIIKILKCPNNYIVFLNISVSGRLTTTTTSIRVSKSTDIPVGGRADVLQYTRLCACLQWGSSIAIESLVVAYPTSKVSPAIPLTLCSEYYASSITKTTFCLV